MKVLIADQFEQFGIDALTAAGCNVSYKPDLVDAALAAAIRSSEADVLIVRSTKVTADMLDGGPSTTLGAGPSTTLRAGRLSLIVRAGAGVNTIDVAAASARGVYVSNCPGKNSVAVAELAMGLLIALDRRIPDNVVDLREGRWNKKQYSKARGLHGRTLGLLGFGSIGREVARRARAFGMPVLVWSRRFTLRGAAALEALVPDIDVTIVNSPEELAERSDAVSLHLALTAETRNFVGRGILERMKPGAIFINTARAELVDHAALIDAVKTYHLRVGLDVFPGEPSQGTASFADPITLLPEVYGTHHIGASTDQAQSAIAAEAVRIVVSYKDTGKVPNVVNLSKTSPATYMLVVRHRDRPGVLAHVFEHLRKAHLNVQETENIIFEGAEAAVARINLDGAPADQLLSDIALGNEHILGIKIVKRVVSGL